MEKKSKIGILKYIAKSGAKGCKFEDQPETWYNPATDEAKGQVKEEYKGKQVEIMLVPGKKTEFSSMVLLEVGKKEEREEEVEVETIQDEPEEKMTDEEKVKHRMGTTEEEPGPELLEEDEKKLQSIENEMIYGQNPMKMMLKAAAAAVKSQEYTQKVFADMEKTKLDTATKGSMKLTYASWAEAWGALKRAHPTANFEVHENKEGMPFFMSELPNMGAFVKVSVTVMGLTHTVHLPVMNHMNKSINKSEMTTFDVNKNIQRALAKAIALHGMGLYVFKGEDLPKD